MPRARSIAGLMSRFNSPVYLLPLDLFRVLTGFIAFAYFTRILINAPDFSDPRGLIDHDLSGEIFPFTRIGLFHSGMDLFTFRVIYALAMLAAAGLILGYRSKLCAACLYVVAVSVYRWNFLVIYVDDAIMHLMLFWMLLLPVGRTLTLREWLTDRRGSWRRWKSATAPGATVRCFVANIALIYLVAGSWKWTSPMWREGTAVSTILETPLSYAPDWWGERHRAFLGVMNYLALVFEPLFPLICVLRNLRPVRYLLIAALSGFHVFILATLKIPYANAACLAAVVVLARDDLMSFVHRQSRETSTALPTGMRLDWNGVCAAAIVVALTLAMATSVTLPDWREPSDVRVASMGSLGGPTDAGETAVDGLQGVQRVFFSALWTVGLAQQYQLLNWIDQRNFRFIYVIEEIRADSGSRPIDAQRMFPESLRSALLQSYLHGAVWIRIPLKDSKRLTESLKTRLASRYCRLFQPSGTLVVKSAIRRPGAKAQASGPTPSFQMEFTCKAGTPVLVH